MPNKQVWTEEVHKNLIIGVQIAKILEVGKEYCRLGCNCINT